MKKAIILTALVLMSGGIYAQQAINDNNTPLHLMKPEYKYKYGVSSVNEVKSTIDRVLYYIDEQTPAQLVDKTTGKEITDLNDISLNTQLKQGGFRLTSYEWGVTYSSVLAAYEATGDAAYLNYAKKRFRLLADIAPKFTAIYKKNTGIDGNIRRMIDPHALDDSGAICASMIKYMLTDKQLQLDGLIQNYIQYILNKEYRLEDGTFARLRPHKNTVWLDDMFMGIPAIAYYARYTNDNKLYDAAAKQVLLFADKMFLPEKGLFRHGWVEEMDYHPAFHWGRANGWAILTMCEVLDVLPENHTSRNAILSLFKQHAIGLSKVQDKDGFWHQLLDHSDTYLESSATAIYTYCLAHGINKGWIDPLSFGPVVQLAWHAVESSVNEKGQVEGVCVGTGMGFDPAFYAYRPVHVMAAHGYGPVIWAGAEMIKMLQQQHPKSNDSAIMFYRQEVKTNHPIFNYNGTIRY
ncbi:MAG: glycoside hydrolase family 88 protein [Prevotella sp.]|nr:glycoside hydrolase family 88 protein [Prevotella sp.]